MLTEKGNFFFLLCITSLYYNFANGQCTVTPNPTAKTFPDPRLLYGLSTEYQLSVEVNDLDKAVSMYAAEYFGGYEGRVDTTLNGKKQSFLYFHDTGEGFKFEAGFPDCDTTIFSESHPSYEQVNVFEWKFGQPNKTNFGPFAMLLNGFDQKSNMEYEDKKKVRGFQGHSWRRCENEGKLTIRYITLDEMESHALHGLPNHPVPLRVTVEGFGADGQKYNHSYEFMRFQLKIDDLRLFQIPVSQGCMRLVENVVPYPEVQTGYRFKAEIVYAPLSATDSHEYITHLEVVSDESEGLYAYRTNPWKAMRNGELAVPGDDLFRVFDTKFGFLYEVDKITGLCQFSPQATIQPNLNLPDRQNLSLFEDSMIQFHEDKAEGFQYLGADKERGKMVHIFEKYFGSFISTHYYLSDGERQFDETEEVQVPIKVVYTSFFGSFQGVIVFNIYEFSTHLTHKPEHFDVSACHKDDDQSEWFQVLFPKGKAEQQQIIEESYKIQDQFYKLLEEENLVTPVRIPEMIVDVDVVNLYVTARLLARVPYKYDFALLGKYKFDKPISTNLLSEEDCFKACIESDCKAVSYCGANCAISLEELTDENASKNEKCTLYNRTVLDSHKTISQIYDRINGMIGMEELKLKINIGNSLYTFNATKLKRRIGFGQWMKKPAKPTDLPNRFHLYRSGATFKTKDDFIKVSFSECENECVRNPKCNSISYCMIDSLCVRHQEHAEDLISDDFEDNDQCIILNRYYDDLFTATAGIRKKTKAEGNAIVTTPNNCAKRCRQETSFDCRSFDFCFQKPNEVNCFLHSTHILDDPKGDEFDVDYCQHYSRNYIYDFEEMFKDSVFLGVKLETKMYNVTLELCSKSCADNPECALFDYCRKPNSDISECATTRKDQMGYVQYREKPSCTVYRKKGQDKPMLKAESAAMIVNDNLYADDGKRHVEVIEDTGYSKSLTGGIAFFLFLIGVAIGVVAMFGYGYYKANRKI